TTTSTTTPVAEVLFRGGPVIARVLLALTVILLASSVARLYTSPTITLCRLSASEMATMPPSLAVGECTYPSYTSMVQGLVTTTLIGILCIGLGITLLRAKAHLLEKAFVLKGLAITSLTVTVMSIGLAVVPVAVRPELAYAPTDVSASVTNGSDISVVYTDYPASLYDTLVGTDNTVTECSSLSICSLIPNVYGDVYRTGLQLECVDTIVDSTDSANNTITLSGTFEEGGDLMTKLTTLKDPSSAESVLVCLDTEGDIVWGSVTDSEGVRYWPMPDVVLKINE
ncbi:hypothetical protein KIPB_008732, partial [Kipferlia bialata]